MATQAHIAGRCAARGRREQKERERKRAAAICQSLEQYLPPKKKITAANDDAVGSKSASDTSMASSSAATVVSATQRSEVDFSSEHPSSESATALLPSCSRSTDNDRESERCHEKTGQACTSTPVDIGDVFSQAKTSGEFCRAMQTLTAAQKYNLLKYHKVASQRLCVSHPIPWWLQPFFSTCVVDRASLDGLQ